MASDRRTLARRDTTTTTTIPSCRTSNSCSKPCTNDAAAAAVAVAAASACSHKDRDRRRQRQRQNRLLYAIHPTPTCIGRILLLCCYIIYHNNIQYSRVDALVRDVRIQQHGPSVSTSFRDHRTIRHSSTLSWMSTTSVEENELVEVGTTTTTTAAASNTAAVARTTPAFASSVRTLFKPTGQVTVRKNHIQTSSSIQNGYYGGRVRDFQEHEEQQRTQLDWIVRNTAKVLGEDAPPPGEMTPQLVRITHSLIRAWAQRAADMQSSNAPHVVEKLLQRLLSEKRMAETGDGNGNGDDKNRIHITLDDYNSLLEAWSYSKEPGSTDRAEAILMKMEQEHEPKPDCRSYNAVIKALVKNGDRQSAASKVESLVLKMESNGDITAMPNRRSYNFLLYALANSYQADAAERATRHLERMILRYHSNTPKENNLCQIQPDLNSFNQVIGAWARGKAPNYTVEMQRVYNLLLELSTEYGIQPDADTYNNLMGGWLKSNKKEALSEIQQLFSTMEESYKNGNELAQPDRVSVNSLQTAFNKFSRGSNAQKQIELETEYGLPPNSHSQNILMESIIKSGAKDAPEQALEILTAMENNLKNGERTLKPDVCSYIAVIKAHVKYKRRNTEAKTDELLARAWDLNQKHGGDTPDIALYNCAMNAYASINSYRVLKKVKDLLKKLENGETEGLPKPNLITYNTVIKAMRNGNKEREAIFAEEILSKLESLGTQNPKLLPDNYSYTSVITAYARSSLSNKAEKALEIVERMMKAQRTDKGSAVITSHTFNAALNSCAFVKGSVEQKARAFEIATKLDKLRTESGELGDSTWYGTMLRACSSLIAPSEYREKMVDLFFQEACDKGCVGILVLQQLTFAATREQKMRLLMNQKFEEGDYVELLERLPREWTCNAREWQPSHLR